MRERKAGPSVLVAAVIAVLANACRVVATGLIGQPFGVEYAQGFFHTFSGWVIFAFACLLGVRSLIRLAHEIASAKARSLIRRGIAYSGADGSLSRPRG